MNPLRVDYIRSRTCDTLQLAPDRHLALQGLRVLDVGCGGGLLSEALGRLGATVLGVDAEESTVGVAVHHLHCMSTELVGRVDYRCTTVEELTAQQQEVESFDVVCAMEVVEHVADVPLFLSSLCQLAKPGAPIFMATLNRTVKSLALGVVAAEEILGVVPPRTHDWAKFLAPEELESMLQENHVRVLHKTGVLFDPFRWRFWMDDRRLDVNYMLHAQKNVSPPRGSE